MKRAKKLKYNAQRRQKLSKLGMDFPSFIQKFIHITLIYYKASYTTLIPLIQAIEYFSYRCCRALRISEEGNRDCRTTQSYRSCKKSSSKERILQRYRINVFIIIGKLPFQFLACLYIMHDFVTCVECTWISDRMCHQSGSCAYSFLQLWRKKLVERM